MGQPGLDRLERATVEQVGGVHRVAGPAQLVGERDHPLGEPLHVMEQQHLGHACNRLRCRRVPDRGGLLDVSRQPSRDAVRVSLRRSGVAQEGDPADLLDSIVTTRPSRAPKSHTSIAGGSMPRLVSAVQSWLRWSVPWWSAWASRIPSGACVS